MTRDEFYKALDESLSMRHYQHLGASWGKRHGSYPIPANELSGKMSSTVYPSNMIGMTEKEKKKWDKKDSKFLAKESSTKKIENRVRKQSKKELREVEKLTDREGLQKWKTNGKLTSAYMLSYNQKVADILNRNIGDVRVPSERYVIKFIANRGSLGVSVAMATPGYDMAKVNTTGMFANGKIGYKNAFVSTTDDATKRR